MTQVSGTFPQLSDGRRKALKPMRPANRNLPDELDSPPPRFKGKPVKVDKAARSARLASMNRATSKMQAQLSADRASMFSGGVMKASPAPPGMAARRARSHARLHGK